MKKIINGKLYDTEKAERLHEWSNMANVTDFKHYTETLYKTAKGTYFLHGQGGPASPYAVQVDNNSYGGGEGITPMTTEAAAVEWLEKHDGDLLLESRFSNYIEEA